MKSELKSEASAPGGCDVAQTKSRLELFSRANPQAEFTKDYRQQQQQQYHAVTTASRGAEPLRPANTQSASVWQLR